MGRVVNDGAMVYRKADFDAQVLGHLKKGQVYPISSKVVGAFYKIKVKEGVYGYIADTDIHPLLSPAEMKKRKQDKAKKAKNKDRGEEDKDKPAKRKSLEWQRDRGFEYAYINFRENTMGLHPTEAISFYGAKFSGPDILMEGMYLDANILLSPSAPKYYQQATGNSASGMILLMDFLFTTAIPDGKNSIWYYGFGPMLKYSRFDTTVTANGKQEAFELTDISAGAVFNLGYGHDFGSWVLRGEIQYYWEQMMYMGFAASVQLPF